MISAGRHTFHPQRAPLSFVINIADLQSIKLDFKEMWARKEKWWLALEAQFQHCSYKWFRARRKDKISLSCILTEFRKAFLLSLLWQISIFCFIFFLLQEALKVMEFTEEEIRDVFKLLSAVLQMGNIEFMTAGGAQITSKGGRRGNNQRCCLSSLLLLIMALFPWKENMKSHRLASC